MNAATTPRKTAPPRTVEDLNVDLAAIEHELMVAERAHSNARNELPNLITGGDAEAISECRKTMASSWAQIVSLRDEMEAQQQAVLVAKNRDRAAASARAYKDIKTLVGQSREQVEALGAAVTNLAEAIKASVAGINSASALMRRSGVEPDRYLLEVKLIGILERALWVETEGTLGHARGLDSRDQLRKNGQADLGRAGREYEELTLQRVRSVLHIRS